MKQRLSSRFTFYLRKWTQQQIHSDLCNWRLESKEYGFMLRYKLKAVWNKSTGTLGLPLYCFKYTDSKCACKAITNYNNLT